MPAVHQKVDGIKGDRSRDLPLKFHPVAIQLSPLRLQPNGPASSPILFMGKLTPLNKLTKAAGSLVVFVSFTILPYVSTMHTLENSKDTLIPP
jgi:hypothetical protein